MVEKDQSLKYHGQISASKIFLCEKFKVLTIIIHKSFIVCCSLNQCTATQHFVYCVLDVDVGSILRILKKLNV